MAIHETECRCGKKVTVRTGIDSRTQGRRDGKQVVYTGDENRYPGREYDVFRCDGCGEPINETCALAAYE